MCPSVTAAAVFDEEGAPKTVLLIPINSRDTIVADIDTVDGHTTVRSFSVMFAGPRTRAGIGVGSAFRDLKAKYGRLEAGDNEGAVYVWADPDDGVSFELSTMRDLLVPGWQQHPASIPDTTRVIEVLIRRVERGR